MCERKNQLRNKALVQLVFLLIKPKKLPKLPTLLQRLQLRHSAKTMSRRMTRRTMNRRMTRRTMNRRMMRSRSTIRRLRFDHLGRFHSMLTLVPTLTQNLILIQSPTLIRNLTLIQSPIQIRYCLHFHHLKH